jgi:A/G-specific adenine glycosylase
MVHSARILSLGALAPVNLDYTFILPLLAWFEKTAADLPWRRSHNPYHVWLSEIMLQQTQVATVIPYYEHFLERFPTIEALANAPQDDLLKQWEGLGYYSRARNLQAAARQIMDAYNGELPCTAAALQNLKGIGRYTAGAIASIAFGESVPVLDGNVIRVFSRLFDIDEDVTLRATQKTLWQLADSLMSHVPADRAGDYNQALMELGRRVCKPRKPTCHICPIADCCGAKANDVQNQRPVKSPKTAIPHYDVTCGLIYNNRGELLIAKRRDEDLLGGLWEFPGGKVEAGETLEECLTRELYEELGIRVQIGNFYLRVKHAYTHFRITLHAFECGYDPADGNPACHQCADWQWVAVADLKNFAFSRADRKIIESLHDRSNRLF